MDPDDLVSVVVYIDQLSVDFSRYPNVMTPISAYNRTNIFFVGCLAISRRSTRSSSRILTLLH